MVPDPDRKWKKRRIRSLILEYGISLNKFKNNLDQYTGTKFDMDRLKGPWPINFQLT